LDYCCSQIDGEIIIDSNQLAFLTHVNQVILGYVIRDEFSDENGRFVEIGSITKKKNLLKHKKISRIKQRSNIVNFL
jgi:hypothetical protein